MDAILVDLCLVIIAGGVGVVAGHFLRRIGHHEATEDAERNLLRKQLDDANLKATTQKKKALSALREIDAARGDAASARDEAERAKDALVKLQALAQNMAANVSNHNSRVQEINSELTPDLGPENVVDVVTQLITANQTMQKQLETAEERLADQAEQLKTHVLAARTDPLTRLANRRGFDDELKKCEAAFETSGTPTSILMLDVDHFKKVNDIHGHFAGDEVLRSVADILRDQFQGNETVCRWGGEEFAIIFPGLEIEQAVRLGERSRVLIGQSILEFEGVELGVTASGGFAALQSGETLEALLKRADEALFDSKQGGRNCAYWHDGKTSHRVELESPNEDAEQPVPVGKDRLTGLPLRPIFIQDVERRLAAQRRGRDPITVIRLQIDRFQTIANHTGFDGRDTLLKATARFIRATMRDMDHVARYGECEFAVMMPGANQQAALLVVERLRNGIAECQLPDEIGIPRFTVSIGYSESTLDDTPETLLGRVGMAVKAAQEQGGNLATRGDEMRSTSAGSEE